MKYFYMYDTGHLFAFLDVGKLKHLIESYYPINSSPSVLE